MQSLGSIYYARPLWAKLKLLLECFLHSVVWRSTSNFEYHNYMLQRIRGFKLLLLLLGHRSLIWLHVRVKALNILLAKCLQSREAFSKPGQIDTKSNRKENNILSFCNVEELFFFFLFLYNKLTTSFYMVSFFFSFFVWSVDH